MQDSAKSAPLPKPRVGVVPFSIQGKPLATVPAPSNPPQLPPASASAPSPQLVSSGPVKRANSAPVGTVTGSSMPRKSILSNWMPVMPPNRIHQDLMLLDVDNEMQDELMLEMPVDPISSNSTPSNSIPTNPTPLNPIPLDPTKTNLLPPNEISADYQAQPIVCLLPAPPPTMEFTALLSGPIYPFIPSVPLPRPPPEGPIAIRVSIARPNHRRMDYIPARRPPLTPRMGFRKALKTSAVPPVILGFDKPVLPAKRNREIHEDERETKRTKETKDKGEG
ncbi:hypothetical protein BDD12DRAFT_809239 [Trichophaea hybrida]|nr:hypothetical protein BDD12DRAFT_809239 [Trichophaea hybrida]